MNITVRNPDTGRHIHEQVPVADHAEAVEYVKGICKLEGLDHAHYCEELEDGTLDEEWESVYVEESTS